MLRRLPKGGRVCELGTFRGDFARCIQRLNALDELHLVDVSFAACGADIFATPNVRTHETTT